MSKLDDPPMGILTQRQMEILRMRREGMSSVEVARRLGTTRQNVTILERRANRKIEEAAATLRFVQESNLGIVVRIPAGTHILDATKMLLERADSEEIKLKTNMVELISWVKTSLGDSLSSGETVRECTVFISISGRCLTWS